MSTIELPPELERFAADAVASGRYHDRAEVVTTAVILLQRAEAHRAKLAASVREAEAEADRDGWASLEEVEKEMRGAIREAARQST